MSARRLGGRVAKLEDRSGSGWEPYRSEVLDGTEAEIAAKLAELERREGKWIAVKVVPAVGQSVNDVRHQAGLKPLDIAGWDDRRKRAYRSAP